MQSLMAKREGYKESLNTQNSRNCAHVKTSFAWPHGRTWSGEVHCEPATGTLMGDLEKDGVETDGAKSICWEATEFLCLFYFFLQKNNDLKTALESNEWEPPCQYTYLLMYVKCGSLNSFHQKESWPKCVL